MRACPPNGWLILAVIAISDTIPTRTVLEASTCHLLTHDDNVELIMDYGCSKQPISPCEADFIPESNVAFPVPLTMYGITGQLGSHQKGHLQYEVLLNDAISISIIKCNGYLLQDLKI
jgi:hypothetical protein